MSQENSPENKTRLRDMKIFQNPGLKLISIFLAVILWLIVMNVDDYSMTKTIKGIPVEQLNGSAIENMGKVYDVVNGKTVDIVVKGPRSVVDSLTADNFYASADLSEVSVTNSVQIKVVPRDTRVMNNLDITYVNNTMNLTIEDKIKKDISIRAVAEGQPAEGYALGTVSVSPNIIQVSGPQSIVSKVTEVRAVLNVSGKDQNVESRVTPRCMNAYGEALSSDSLQLSLEEVKVTAKIFPTKEIPIRVSVTGTPKTDYVVTDVNYTPQTIVVAGAQQILDGVSAIEVNDIGVDDASESFEINRELDSYLPDGIYLADSNKEVAVSLTMERKQEKEIEITAEDVEMRGASDALVYELVVSGVYKIRLKGLAAELAEVTKESLGIYLNVEGKEPGKVDVSPSYQKPNGVTVNMVGRMTLYVTEKAEPPTEENTGEPGENPGDNTGEGSEGGTSTSGVPGETGGQQDTP